MSQYDKQLLKKAYPCLLHGGSHPQLKVSCLIITDKSFVVYIGHEDEPRYRVTCAWCGLTGPCAPSRAAAVRHWSRIKFKVEEDETQLED